MGGWVWRRLAHALKMTVREMIKQDAVTLKSMNSLEKAALLMHDHKIGCLVVVNQAGG
jgi:predicted transcriptional regulator